MARRKQPRLTESLEQALTDVREALDKTTPQPGSPKESEEYLISVLEAVREALQDNDVDGALLMIKTALGEVPE